MAKRWFSYIRYSHPTQALGKSLERQLEKAERYARSQGWENDPKLNLRDLGVSGYNGKNVREGALAILLEKENRIPPGTVLVVESLDRISRMNPYDSFKIVQRLLDKKIEIFSLEDEVHYSLAAVKKKPHLLQNLHGKLERAHNESKMKSERVGDAWKRLKDEARNGRKITARCPLWLELRDGQFQIVEDRAKVVNEIFQMRVHDNKGKRLIADELNRRGVPCFGMAGKWGHSYVHKILTNPAVVGEYQPYEKVEITPKDDEEWKEDEAFAIPQTTRSKAGHAISNYYPAIIDVETFKRAGERLTAGRSGSSNHRRDKKGNIVLAAPKVSNLFTGLTFYVDDNTPIEDEYEHAMEFVDKGTEQKGQGKWKYLVARHKGSWNYLEFEELFLNYIENLDWTRIAGRNARSQTTNLSRQISAIQAAIRQQEIIRDGNAKAIDLGSVSRMVVQKLDQAEAELDKLNEQLKAAEEERERLSVRGISEGEVESLRRAGTFEARLRLKSEIRRQVSRIMLNPKTKSFTVHFMNGEFQQIWSNSDGEYDTITPIEATRVLAIAAKVRRTGDQVSRSSGSDN